MKGARKTETNELQIVLKRILDELISANLNSPSCEFVLPAQASTSRRHGTISINLNLRSNSVSAVNKETDLVRLCWPHFLNF